MIYDIRKLIPATYKIPMPINFKKTSFGVPGTDISFQLMSLYVYENILCSQPGRGQR